MSRNPIHEVAAAVMLFTRLPLGRIWPPLSERPFSFAVTWWPLSGWLTATVTLAVIAFMSRWTGIAVAVVTALAVRMMLTGALHEDGLADVADGLGGRVGRERALAIMKDSQIGSYGVLALVLYCMMFVATATSVALVWTMCMIACADPWARFCAGRLTAILPYARPEGAKNGLAYPRPGPYDWTVAFLFGGAPIVVCAVMSGSMVPVWSAVAPIVAVAVLTLWFRKRIGGYTGDCCGAACLICETVYMLTFCMLT